MKRGKGEVKRGKWVYLGEVLGDDSVAGVDVDGHDGFVPPLNVGYGVLYLYSR